MLRELLQNFGTLSEVNTGYVDTSLGEQTLRQTFKVSLNKKVCLIQIEKPRLNILAIPGLIFYTKIRSLVSIDYYGIYKFSTRRAGAVLLRIPIRFVYYLPRPVVLICEVRYPPIKVVHQNFAAMYLGAQPPVAM